MYNINKKKATTISLYESPVKQKQCKDHPEPIVNKLLLLIKYNFKNLKKISSI